MWLTLTPHESTSSWLGAAGRSVGAVMRIRCSVEGRQRTAAPLATARRSPRWQSSHPRSPRQRQAKGVQEEGAGALRTQPAVQWWPLLLPLPHVHHFNYHPFKRRPKSDDDNDDNDSEESGCANGSGNATDTCSRATAVNWTSR
jgi:hypothetical protein